jgi:uncharacterized membrane protein
MLPKVKSNFYIGIRTSWTLSDSDIWNRTNRLGGFLFFIMGLVLILCGLLCSTKLSFAVLMVGAFIVSLVPTVASYLWWREKEKQGE